MKAVALTLLLLFLMAMGLAVVIGAILQKFYEMGDNEPRSDE